MTLTPTFFVPLNNSEILAKNIQRNIENIYYFLESMKGAITYSDIMNMSYLHYTKMLKLKENMEKERKKQNEEIIQTQKTERMKLESKQKHLQSKARISQQPKPKK